MKLTAGDPRVRVGLIDGPVQIEHPGLANAQIKNVNGLLPASCAIQNSLACQHGTFVAGILAGHRDSESPAICPKCTFLIRAIFAETTRENDAGMPSTTPEHLAEAITQTIDAGAHIINLSVGITGSSSGGDRALGSALDFAARREVLVVVASGNQGSVGGSILARHPWVIPVVACDRRGYPMNHCNIGASIGRHGLRAPGEKITSLGSNGVPRILSGTSAAAPFVTGALALLRSEFPQATAAAIKQAVTQSDTVRRTSVVPPLLDGWGAYKRISRL